MKNICREIVIIYSDNLHGRGKCIEQRIILSQNIGLVQNESSKKPVQTCGG